MTRASLAAVGALALIFAGCGSAADDPATVERSSRLVDFTKKPPFLNALDIDPATKEFLLTTNRGFYRIAPDGGKVTPVRGTISAQGKRSTIGTFLELLAVGPGQLVGSGHPDQQGTLPAFLGFIISDDGGKTWTAVSRLGNADLHKIVRIHDRMYAFDAVLSAILISSDGGRTFTENFTPRGLIIDFEVDPADPKRIVASNDGELFRSTDTGASWRPLDRRAGDPPVVARSRRALPRAEGRDRGALKRRRRHLEGGVLGSTASHTSSRRSPRRAVPRPQRRDDHAHDGRWRTRGRRRSGRSRCPLSLQKSALFT